MIWAGRHVLGQDEAQDQRDRDKVLEDRSFRESNIGVYTPESVNAYLEGGREDTSLLQPIQPTGSGVTLTGQDNARIEVENVPGFGDQTIYVQEVEDAAGNKYDQVRYIDPSTGEYATARYQDFENIIVQSGGSINTSVLSGGDKTKAITSYVNSNIVPNINTKLEGLDEGKFAGVGGNWKSSIVNTARNAGYDLTNPDVAAAYETIAYQAADRAIGSMASDGNRVNSLGPIIRDIINQGTAMNPNDSIWGSGKRRASERKIAELQDIMFNQSGGDLGQVKTAFLAYVNKFNSLDDNDLNKYKPGKGENKFYVWLHDQLTS